MNDDSDGWGFNLPVGCKILLEKSDVSAWTARLISAGGLTFATATHLGLPGLVPALLGQARKDGVIP